MIVPVRSAPGHVRHVHLRGDEPAIVLGVAHPVERRGGKHGEHTRVPLPTFSPDLRELPLRSAAVAQKGPM
jgi:hypothetical protein